MYVNRHAGTGMAVLCRAALAGAVLLAAAPAAAKTLVAEYAGSEDFRTEPFEVAGPWEVRWRSDGRRLQILTFREGTATESVAVSTSEPREGVTPYFRGGTYRLEIRASGPWSVQIYEWN